MILVFMILLLVIIEVMIVGWINEDKLGSFGVGMRVVGWRLKVG